MRDVLNARERNEENISIGLDFTRALLRCRCAGGANYSSGRRGGVFGLFGGWLGF